VSIWVTEVTKERLDDAQLDRLWGAFYRSVAPTREDVRAGDAAFERLTGRTRRRRTPLVS